MGYKLKYNSSHSKNLNSRIHKIKSTLYIKYDFSKDISKILDADLRKRTKFLIKEHLAIGDDKFFPRRTFLDDYLFSAEN